MKRLLLVLLVIVSLNSYARQYYFRQYKTEDGMSNNTVHCCLQDKRGFMWFGTQDGLNRFDGFRFHSFTYQPNIQNSLINNIIYSLEEDQDGWIWIGTDRGICYYNPETDKFNTLDGLEYKISGMIYDIKTDLKNNIWVISDQGIYCYSKSPSEIKFYPSYRHFSPTSICITAAGDVWFSSTDGKLYNYDNRIASFRVFPVLSKEELETPVLFLKTVETNENQLLVITRKAGIKSFNPNSGQITDLFTSDKDGQVIIINDLIKIENKYWIASESGIHIFDRDNGLEENIRNTPNNAFSLSNNAVKSIIQDSEGGIWLGTYYGGLNYFPRESTPFIKYYSLNSPGYLNGNVVKAICKDKNGAIWVGTEDAGLNKMNLENGTFEDYSFKNKSNGINSSNIQAILADNNDLWIATHDNGVFRFDIESEKVKQHFCAPKKKNGLNKYQVESFLSLLKTQNGTIYIGSTIGMYKYNPEQKILDYMHNLAPQTRIIAMHEDKEGLVWIGTLGSGVFIYNQKSDLSKHLYHIPDSPKSLGSDFITSIFEDSSNRIWLTTERDGLCRVSKDDYTFTTFNKDDGIPAGITCSIIEDGQGILWITSTNGLIKFNPTNQEAVTFRKSNGLIDNHFCYNSSFKDNTGVIYFGSVNGMISFNPANFEPKNYFPRVYITALQTAGTSKHPEEYISQDERSILNSEEVRLYHYQSTFTIDFASPSYTNPSLTKYRYKLEGVDKEWRTIPTNRRVYYTNVPPGKYSFLVTSMDDNKEWTSNQASIGIKIIPPLSKSKGAIVLYCIVIVFFCHTFFRIYKNKKQLEIQQKLYRMEQLREKELLNSKISFFTNITHEVRTPLTLIKAPLDRILNNEKFSEMTTHNLLIMKKNTDRLLKLTYQLLDFRKTETDLLKLDYQSVHIKTTINDIYSRFLPTAKDKSIDFQVFMPEKDIIINIDEETVTKILSNLFNNAIKYTQSIIQVHVEYKKNNEEIVIRVNSDGDRIPEEFHKKIFEPFFKLETDHTTAVPQGSGLGLPLARSLAELHHGKLFIDTSNKEFNSFVLKLPSSVKAEPEKKKTIPKVLNKIKTKIEPKKETFDQSKPVILIVDDEEEMCDFIAAEISESFNVLKAYNGDDAYNIICNKHVSLVVSDVLMPIMDGYELCEKIKNNLDYSHIPIILLTASISLNARIEGLECGADAYLEKPFTTELLVAQIENLFKNKEVASENFMNSPFTHYKTVAVNKMDEDFMKGLHSIIVKHLSESKLSVEMIANTMGMSVSTLYRKVKAITKLNTNEYIRLYRLKKAAEMLASREYRINEVSYQVGFSSPSYFTTSFQKQFGVSPSQFLKQQMQVKKSEVTV